MVDAQDFDDIDENNFGNDLFKMGEHLMRQDMFSIVDSRYQSFITNKQEQSIPNRPIMLNQNKKLVNILFEAKETIDEEIKHMNLMTTKEEEKACTVPELKEFFHKIMMLLDRWMKVMTHEEGDFASSLIIDNIFKALIIKLDKVYGVKDRIVDEEQEWCQESVIELKKTCKDKLDLQLIQFKMREENLEKQIAELNRKLDGQTKMIEQLQSNLDHESLLLRKLTSHEARNNSVKELQDSFMAINELITDQQTFQTNQNKLLGQYTKMVDIGTQKKPRSEQNCQTDVTHNC